MPKKEKTLCKNCGHPATFGERADFERVKLGWCSSCFRQSRRNFEIGGKKHYFDEYQTMDNNTKH